MSHSTSNASGPGEAPHRRSRGRWIIVAMLAVALAPFVLSYLAYEYWQPRGRVNYGELIDPRALPQAPLQQLDGRPFRPADLEGKWVLLHADGGACGESCRRQLYLMRQVRLAQGANFERIERVWLVTDDVRPAADLAPLLEGVWIVRAGGTPLVAALPAPADLNHHVYLVDPLGNLMLRFPRDPDPAGMIKDLQRLLKLSRIG